MTDVIRHTTIAEIVQHYGGPERFAERFGQTVGNVNSWIARKGIPPRYYLQHKAILDADNIKAPAALWGQVGAVAPKTNEAAA